MERETSRKIQELNTKQKLDKKEVRVINNKSINIILPVCSPIDSIQVKLLSIR